jgi:hypothetical protein
MSKRPNDTADDKLLPVEELVKRLGKPEFRASLTPLRGVTAMDPDSREELEAWFQQLRRLLEARTFREGFPHLLGGWSRMKAVAAQLLTEATPEQLAAAMNRIRPGRDKAALKRRNLPYEMTAEAARRMQATMTASELADLIESALEDGRPNESGKNGHGHGCAGYVDAFDALRQVEVEGYELPADKDNPVVRHVQKALRMLGRAKNVGRPKGSKARPGARKAGQERRKADLMRRNAEHEQWIAELVCDSRAAIGSAERDVD